jgi:hypothetical protein
MFYICIKKFFTVDTIKGRIHLIFVLKCACDLLNHTVNKVCFILFEAVLFLLTRSVSHACINIVHSCMSCRDPYTQKKKSSGS